MAGNKGTLGGWEKNKRKRREWVYHSLPSPKSVNGVVSGSTIAAFVAPNGTDYTATQAVAKTSPLQGVIGGSGAAGGGGSVSALTSIPGLRALNILMIARNSTVDDGYFYVNHFDRDNPLLQGKLAAECHFGKVAGHYDTASAMVECDPDGRIWWGLSYAGTGTSTLYLRVQGYWTAVD